MPLRIIKQDPTLSGIDPGPAHDRRPLSIEDEEATPVLDFDPAMQVPAVSEGGNEESAFLASMRQLFADMRSEAESGDVMEGPSGSAGREVV